MIAAVPIAVAVAVAAAVSVVAAAFEPAQYLAHRDLSIKAQGRSLGKALQHFVGLFGLLTRRGHLCTKVNALAKRGLDALVQPAEKVNLELLRPRLDGLAVGLQNVGREQALGKPRRLLDVDHNVADIPQRWPLQQLPSQLGLLNERPKLPLRLPNPWGLTRHGASSSRGGGANGQASGGVAVA